MYPSDSSSGEEDVIVPEDAHVSFSEPAVDLIPLPSPPPATSTLVSPSNAAVAPSTFSPDVPASC